MIICSSRGRGFACPNHEKALRFARIDVGRTYYREPGSHLWPDGTPKGLPAPFLATAMEMSTDPKSRDVGKEIENMDQATKSVRLEERQQRKPRKKTCAVFYGRSQTEMTGGTRSPLVSLCGM